MVVRAVCQAWIGCRMFSRLLTFGNHARHMSLSLIAMFRRDERVVIGRRCVKRSGYVSRNVHSMAMHNVLHCDGVSI